MKRGGANARGAGVGLVELVLSLAILVVVVGAMAAATVSAQRAFRASLARGELDTAARRTIDRIAEDLRTAGRAGLVPVPVAPLGSSSLRYQRNVGWEAGEVVWSSPLTIELVAAPDDPTNGADDDGDGMVDERCVVWTRDAGTSSEISTSWTCGVPRLAEGELANGLDDDGDGLADEAGLSFVLEGDVLVIRLTLRRSLPGDEVLMRSVEAAVALRN